MGNPQLCREAKPPVNDILIMLLKEIEDGNRQSSSRNLK